MSNINVLVEQALTEDKGQTAGAEMFNKGKIAGLYSEPGFDGKDGKRGNNSTDSAGEKVVKQDGTNQSKFDVDSTPGNSEPTNPNPDAGNNPPVNKFGDSSMFAAVEKLIKPTNANVVKSDLVKNKLKDQPEMPKSAPK